MSDSDRKRAQRVGELILHELANVITNELKDPRVGFVTVTEVRVTGDLRSARVFVSILGPPEQRAASIDGLRAAAGYLKHILSERLELRWVPDLAFEADESLDRAQRLESIMQAIAKGDTETPAETPEAPLEARTYRSELAEKRRTFSEAEKQTKPDKPSKPGSRPHRRTRR